MSLNGVIHTFRIDGTVTVTRRTPGTYVLGRHVPGDPTVLVLNDSEDNAVSIVPASGQQVRSQSEGQLAENTRILYSRVQLQARSPSGPGDIVTLSDGDYEVTNVKDWSGLVGDGSQNCWECVIAKQETP